MSKRIRRVGSIKNELLKKSQEAALTAVQIFNNPTIQFKSESYVVLMIIAWTYLLHAYFHSKKIEYRCLKKNEGKGKFSKTKYGSYKFLGLGDCLKIKKLPIDNHTINNLCFILELRHEIEHKMTTAIDDSVSAKFQSCCLNYNKYIKIFFGDNYSIEKKLSFSLQFSSISKEQKDVIDEYENLPENIKGFLINFESKLTDEEINNEHYAYRILFIPKTANRKGQADSVIEVIKSDSPITDTVNKSYIIKETERKKYLPKHIVELMKKEGYTWFTMHHHTACWKKHDAKNIKNQYGVFIGNQWFWYDKWIEQVRGYCKTNS